MARSKKWTNEALVEAVKNNKSMAGVLRELGVSYGSKKSVLAAIKDLDLDISHFGRRSTGLNQDGRPNAYWRRFKERLDAYDQIPVEAWGEEHVLGHILKRYRDHYGFEYTLSYTGSPSKCMEMYAVRRMLNSIHPKDGNDDMELAKKYVDWIFDQTIIPKKVEVKNLMFFISGNFLYRFKMMSFKSKRITRATTLPQNYLEIAESLNLSVRTYGDLAFAKVAIDGDPSSYTEYGVLFDKLKEAGFSEDVFNKMEA